MIFFTSDIDWAPDEVIDDMLELFNKYNQVCTLFATHKSNSISNVNAVHEVAIHPNFNPMFSDRQDKVNADQIIDTLMDLYPAAKGVRSHSTTTNSGLLDIFFRKGLTYDSNLFLPYQTVKPFKLWNGFTRIPYNWEDDVHFLYNKSFATPDIDMEQDFVIFDFHPVHIYLNTETETRYLNARRYYNEPAELLKNRNTTGPGARTLLISLLEQCAEKKIITDVLSSIS